jgi:hypothetical protein
MARLCTVCMHPQRAEIDRALVKGATERVIMKDFGLSKGSVHRHKLTCAGLAPVATKEKREAQKEVSRGTAALALLPTRDDLSSRYQTLGDRIDEIVAKAEKAGSLAVAVQGLNSLRQNWDSLSKLAGHTTPSPPPPAQVTVNVEVSITSAVQQIITALVPTPSPEQLRRLEVLADE